MKSTKMSLRALTFSAALCASLGTSLSAFAETIEVQKLKHAGPYPVATPWMADSVNVKGEKFSMEGVLDSPLSFTLLNNGKEVAASQLLADSKQNALHLASFTVSNTSRTQATIEVKGLKQYRLFVDGEQVKVNGDKAETVLMPSTHTVVIKFLTASSADASASEKNASEKSSSSEKKADQDFKISITAADGKQLSVGESSASTKRTFNIYDVICMPNYASVQMSPNGKFMIVRKTWVDRQGKNHSVNELRNFSDQQGGCFFWRKCKMDASHQQTLLYREGERQFHCRRRKGRWRGSADYHQSDEYGARSTGGKHSGGMVPVYS